MAQFYFEIYAFGNTIGVDNDSYGTGSDGFVASSGANNAQNNAWGSMQNGGWSVGPDAGAEFYLTSNPTKVGIWVIDDDAYLQDGAGDPGAVQVLAYPVTIDGITFPAGSRVELEYAVDTESGGDGADYYVVRLGGNGLTETQGDTGYNVGILATTDDALQTMTLYHVYQSIDGPSLAYAKALCFAAETMSGTPSGERRCSDLKVGDRVVTRDHGPQEIVWIGRMTISEAELARSPEARPIRFEPGAIGNTRPLTVSPQHRMLVADWRAQLYFGEDGVLVPAKVLVDDRAVRRIAPYGGVEYVHIMCREHEVVLADGAWAESFFPGRSALEMLSAAQLAEIGAILSVGAPDAEARRSCRPAATGGARLPEPCWA